jgi:hypothetical protein
MLPLTCPKRPPYAPLIFGIAGTLDGRLSWRPLFFLYLRFALTDVGLRNVSFGSLVDITLSNRVVCSASERGH